MLRDINSLTEDEIKGLIEFLSSFRSPERVELYNKVIEKRTNYFTIVLENIDKAHNASAVIRTCECFGIQNVHFIDDHSTYDVSKGVVMGASKWVTLNKYDQLEQNSKEALLAIKNQGYRLVATVPNENASDLNSFDITKGPAAFIFGTELTGVSDTVIEMADEFVYIPMVGFTESLNLSVSAAVILQKVTNQMYNSPDIDWQLTHTEKEKLMLEWLRKSTPRIETIEKRYFDASIH